jgi:hypothetical protein
MARMPLPGMPPHHYHDFLLKTPRSQNTKPHCSRYGYDPLTLDQLDSETILDTPSTVIPRLRQVAYKAYKALSTGSSLLAIYH